MDTETGGSESDQSLHAAHPAEDPATLPAGHASRFGKRWIIIGILLAVIVLLAVAFLVTGAGKTSRDPIIGTWSIGSTNLSLQVAEGGSATIRYPGTGYSATGRWERIAENRYRLVSVNGTFSPPLTYDPIADALHSDDFTLILSRRTEQP